jgi:hypothetical protein
MGRYAMMTDPEDPLDEFRKPVVYPFHSLQDFLISKPLSVDTDMDDGWGARYPIKGRLIRAAILFADISGFSARTVMLSPPETLMFVNKFFCWITAEALRGSTGIIDKYIGDELMIVFSDDFGSADPVLEALRAATRIAQNDAWAFVPHIGIAFGPVVVGFTGTPVQYNCSVFGAPVALAARCASVKISGACSSSVVFPAAMWPDDLTIEHLAGSDAPNWELRDPIDQELKNVGKTTIRALVSKLIHVPSESAEDATRESWRHVKEAGLYRQWNRWESEDV